MHVLLACTLNLTDSLTRKDLRYEQKSSFYEIHKIFLSNLNKIFFTYLLTQVIITDQILTNLISHEDSGEQFFMNLNM